MQRGPRREVVGAVPLLAYIRFDPNREECERFAGQPRPYRSVRYLPIAVAGDRGVIDGGTFRRLEDLESWGLSAAGNRRERRPALSVILLHLSPEGVNRHLLHGLGEILE
jgi:hypothetical protein